MNKNESSWDFVIDSKNESLFNKFLESWDYRDLLILMVKRDIVSFYKQTIFGPLWFVIQPVLSTIIFTVIFGNLAGLSTEGVPKPLFYLAGITCWNYFAETLTKTSTVYRDNIQILSKVYFPRLIMPLSIVFSNLSRFFIQFLLFLIVLLYYKIEGVKIAFTGAIIFFPFLILLMALFGLGIGCLITSMTIKYRDLAFLVVFGVNLLMYCTTVVYPLSSAPESLRSLISLNPMTSVIEIFRYSFFGKGEVQILYIVISVMIAVAILIIGLYTFFRTEKSFVDKI